VTAVDRPTETSQVPAASRTMTPITESLILWQRNTKKAVRVPVVLFFALVQPLIFLLLFSQVFSSLANLPGFQYDSYLQFLVPSIVALTALNSAFSSGMGTVTDIEDGMLDKFLIAPIHRMSIMWGRILADGTRILAQALLIVVIAFFMGTRYATGVLGIGTMCLLAALFGMAWAGLSNIIALRTGNAEATMMFGILITFPILFLSTAFMPSFLLPDWLETVARFNPITYVVESLRALVNDGWDWEAIWQALVVIVLLGAVTLTGATRAFKKAIG
jgi:ABC-2 type transport system permease protein